MKTSSDKVFSERVTNVTDAEAHAFEKHSSASHEISRMDVAGSGNALAPLQLEQRRMIHREESVRQQSDAFREIRTRLLGLAGPQNFVTLVVSVSPGSGGSFVACNLATAFAFDEAYQGRVVREVAGQSLSEDTIMRAALGHDAAEDAA